MSHNFFYLQAQTKAQLREILRPLLSRISYSSLYQLNQQLFMVIKYTDKTNPLPQVFNNCSVVSLVATPLQLLLNWGIAELEDNLDYINYEHNAYSNTFSSILNFHEVEIARLYDNLTEVMLIINQTPDSFSEQGALFQQPQKIIEHIEKEIKNGVSIIDLGAESTRPDAPPISHQEEISRLTPIIRFLKPICDKYQLRLSLDSYKPQTISHFLDQIDIVNDVSGNLPKQLLQQIANTGKTYLCMHSLTIPASREINISINEDPLLVLKQWGFDKQQELYAHGFTQDQIILDIGIGFNKFPAQSWYLLRNMNKLHQLGVSLLVGHSRKSFLNKISNLPSNERDLETAIITEALAKQMIDYVRVHSTDINSRLKKVNCSL